VGQPELTCHLLV